MENDDEFQKYISGISRIKENRKKNFISLNYKKRLEEKKESENQNNNLEISLINSEVFPIENDLLKQKLEKDLYLRESLKLFSDLLEIKS